MTKFKVGDRVRLTMGNYDDIKIGDERVVTGIGLSTNRLYVNGGEDGLWAGYPAEHFELVKDPPLFLKGDRVWSQRWGWGTVNSVGKGEMGVVVNFDDAEYGLFFSADGTVGLQGSRRELFFAEGPAPTPPMLNRPAKVLFPKGAVVAFKNKRDSCVFYRELAADLREGDSMAIAFYDGALDTVAWLLSVFTVTLVSNPATKEQSA